MNFQELKNSYSAYLTVLLASGVSFIVSLYVFANLIFSPPDTFLTSLPKFVYAGALLTACISAIFFVVFLPRGIYLSIKAIKEGTISIAGFILFGLTSLAIFLVGTVFYYLYMYDGDLF